LAGRPVSGAGRVDDAPLGRLLAKGGPG
jgi:hypothetical protein